METRTFPSPSTVPSMETKTNTNNNRLGPLHTCGKAILITAHKAYKKAEGLPDPLGSITQAISTFVGPVMHAMLCYLLVVLSFVDDRVLTIENVVENVFPQSRYVFSKIDAFVHTLPTKSENTLENDTKVSKMENRGNTNRRPGPLHTSGNAMVTTAYKACKRAELLPNPIGTTAQKLGRVGRPIFCTMQNHWLGILSYTDDRILYVENAVENVFPPSRFIFNKIDTLVYVFETLPVKFDSAADKLPAVVQRVPYLEWALAQLLLILSFLINTFTDWGVEGANEKEIRIDTNSHDEIATNDRGLTGNKEMCIPNSSGYGTNGNDIVECEENEKENKETYKDILVKRKDVNEEEMNEKKEATSYKTVLEMGMKKNEDEISQQVEAQSDNKEIGGLTCKKMLTSTRINKMVVK
ncbi:hypothetical protein MKW94_003099 [Papaver nudicaule]|uniref:Uncharacterized protein n=1 Tax=Papaver nudicaule TaxID=74823 RepID=A0AA41V7I0_PAPNU|nr:hypothetical protein [Papaver nudicaule]